MHVVDGDEDRGHLGQIGESTADTGRHSSRIHDDVGIGLKQRRLQGAPLQPWKSLERRFRNQLEQIGERRKRQLRLGFRRTAGQQRETARLRPLRGLLPQRRLPDSRLAFENERARPRPRLGEKRVDRRELGISPEQPPVHREILSDADKEGKTPDSFSATCPYRRVPCRTPGSRAEALSRAGAAVSQLRSEGRLLDLRATILVRSDETVFCFFDGDESDVRSAGELADRPFERVLESVWLEPRGHEDEEA